MFWMVISLFGLAFTFVKLGALMLLVKLLVLGLIVALAVVAGLSTMLLWRRIRETRAR